MPRILVVSVATVNIPHRTAYDRLARQQGWDVHVVAPERLDGGGGHIQVHYPAPPGSSYVLHPLHLRLYSQQRLTVFAGLRSLVRRVSPDLVFLEFDPGSALTLQASEASRGRAKVVCFTVENMARDRLAEAREEVKAGRPQLAVRDVFVWGLLASGERLIDGLACISPDGERVYRARGFDKPIAVMPLGTDMDLFSPGDARAHRSALGLDGAFVVGYFGRLVPEKGPMLLVEALARLPGDVRLLLDMYRNFVPGSYAAQLLERADALGVRNRIVTIDVAHAEVPDYMRVCDVIALPSLTTPMWREQFGRVLPEAMACGVPVIGSRSGNIPELIGHAGILVEEGSAEALADAIGVLRDTPERRAGLAIDGRARIRAHFSVEVQVEIMKELFGRVLAS